MSVTAAAEQPHAFYMNDHWSADIPVGPAKGEASASNLSTFAEDEPSFWDLLDVVNPLQHIPVINTLYRELTGDKIGVGAQLAGGTLFGGPIGLLAAGLNIAVQDATGDDIGGHVLALFRDDNGTPPDDGATQLAAAEPAAPAPSGGVVGKDAFVLDPPPASMPTAPTMWFQKESATASAMTEPTVAQAAPVPLTPPATAPARFMPLPPRGAITAGGNAPPPVSVPISNSGTRSNVPITGRDPVPTTPSPLAVQKIIGQERAAAASVASQDWFSSAMTSGLDKYEQAAKLNRPGSSAPVAVE